MWVLAQAGFDQEQLRALLRRWPPSMTYTTEHWEEHLQYFQSLGVAKATLPQVLEVLQQLMDASQR